MIPKWTTFRDIYGLEDFKDKDLPQKKERKREGHRDGV